jgi:putative transcription factor
MCGQSTNINSLYIVEIEGTTLTICPRCLNKLRNPKIVGKGIKQEKTKKVQKVVQKQQRKTTKNLELELVDDYSQKIKSARESTNMTQEDLANRLRVSVNIVKRIESGRLKPPLDLARKIENILKIKILQPVVDRIEQEVNKAENELTLGDVAEIKRK